MGRLIAARPRHPDALGHPADVTIGLDQLGHELGRQIEPAWRASRTMSSSVGVWLMPTPCHAGLAPGHAVFDHEGRQAADRAVLLLFVIDRLEADRAM